MSVETHRMLIVIAPHQAVWSPDCPICRGTGEEFHGEEMPSTCLECMTFARDPEIDAARDLAVLVFAGRHPVTEVVEAPHNQGVASFMIAPSGLNRESEEAAEIRAHFLQQMNARGLRYVWLKLGEGLGVEVDSSFAGAPRKTTAGYFNGIL